MLYDKSHLQTLSGHLTDREQKTENRTIDKFAAALVRPAMLKHKDKVGCSTFAANLPQNG
jgi:hypothetical protein